MAIYNPLTGYEPQLLDNFDYSETSAAIFQDESGDIDTEPSHSCDAELDDEIIGKALSSLLFTHSLKIEIAKYAKGQKLQGPLAGNAPVINNHARKSLET